MQFYYNLNPPGHDGVSDLVTLEAPTEVMDVLFAASKEIADVKNIAQDKALKYLIQESVKILMERNYERKNRKTKNR
jgi:hypothetical protein